MQEPERSHGKKGYIGTHLVRYQNLEEVKLRLTGVCRGLILGPSAARPLLVRSASLTPRGSTDMNTMIGDLREDDASGVGTLLRLALRKH